MLQLDVAMCFLTSKFISPIISDCFIVFAFKYFQVNVGILIFEMTLPNQGLIL